MDSLTQIVLGAATGELAGGKKIGNKAMFFGAVGGTIPDLDVMVGGIFKSIGLFDDMDALAFHRGISHSIFFAILAPIVIGKILEWHYKNPGRRKYISFIITSLIVGLIAFAINYVFYEGGGRVMNYTVLTVSLFISAMVVLLLIWRYFKKSLSVMDASWKDYAWVFFWSIFTHPLLDCCTTYGTQLFQPFSDYRVGWNNIAVADPAYTVPFALCIILAALFFSNRKIRKYITIVGIAISSVYMIWTVTNKYKVNQVVEESLAEQQISYERYMTVPTILNNFLWSCIVDADSIYYQGFYSILDEDPRVTEWNTFPKNLHLVEGHENDKSLQTLAWFSDDYFVIQDGKDGMLQVNDLRFAALKEGSSSEVEFVFRFILEENNGELIARESLERPPIEEGYFMNFFERIKGIKSTKD